jgi:hypothetical protein
MRNFIICTHLQISLSKSRRMRWAGHVARMGEERKLYKVLVGKSEGKRPLGRRIRRWEDGIRKDLREIGFGGADWIPLSQDRDRWRAVVSAVMNLRVLAPRSYLFSRKQDRTGQILGKGCDRTWVKIGPVSDFANVTTHVLACSLFETCISSSGTTAHVEYFPLV